jgi:hypothetical protein
MVGNGLMANICQRAPVSVHESGARVSDEVQVCAGSPAREQ